jgi:hypothetical protein
MTCLQCGKDLAGSENFCPSCGVKLGETVKITNEATGETFEASGVDFDEWERLNEKCGTDEYYDKWIDGLQVSEKVKETLRKIGHQTIRAGRYVLYIGKLALNFIMKTFENFAARYPNAFYGALIGLTIGLLCSMIPIFGKVLGPVTLPLLTLSGFFMGFILDLKMKINHSDLAEAMRSAFGGMAGTRT